MPKQPSDFLEQYRYVKLNDYNKQNILRNVMDAKSLIQGEFTKEMYQRIVLTEKKNEHFKIKKFEYQQKITATNESKTLDKEEYLRFLSTTFNKRFPSLELKLAGKEASFFSMLASYFTGDQSFFELAPNFSKTTNPQKFSLDKGIILIGAKGVGKTTMMRMFSLNPRMSYKVKSIYHIVREHEDDGMSGIDKFTKFERVSSFDSNNYYFGQLNIGLCIDDMGVKEERIKYYGNDRNVIDLVVQERYFNKIPFNATLITTNSEPPQWHERYDGRTIDRFREMFNVFWYPEIESKRL